MKKIAVSLILAASLGLAACGDDNETVSQDVGNVEQVPDKNCDPNGECQYPE